MWLVYHRMSVLDCVVSLVNPSNSLDISDCHEPAVGLHDASRCATIFEILKYSNMSYV